MYFNFVLIRYERLVGLLSNERGGFIVLIYIYTCFERLTFCNNKYALHCASCSLKFPQVHQSYVVLLVMPA